MFRWGIIFLVIALIAAALGFGSGGYGCLGCKIVFVVGIILFWLACLPGAGAHRKRSFPAAQDAKGVLMT